MPQRTSGGTPPMASHPHMRSVARSCAGNQLPGPATSYSDLASRELPKWGPSYDLRSNPSTVEVSVARLLPKSREYPYENFNLCPVDSTVEAFFFRLIAA